MSRLIWMAVQALFVGWLAYSMLQRHPDRPAEVVIGVLGAIAFCAFLTAILTRVWDTAKTGELKDARETIATLNETAKRVDALAAEARGLEALLEAERKRSGELRADGMRWQGQAEKALAAVPIPQPEKRGFLRRLLG